MEVGVSEGKAVYSLILCGILNVTAAIERLYQGMKLQALFLIFCAACNFVMACMKSN